MHQLSTTTDPMRPARGLLQTAPLLPMAIGLIAGLVTDEFRPVPILWYLLVLIASSLLSLFPGLRIRLSWLLLSIGAWSAGGLLHHQSSIAESPSSILHYIEDTDQIIRVRGTVLTLPKQIPPPATTFRRWQRASWRTSFLLATSAVETIQGWRTTQGRLRVLALEPVLDLEAGESVELFGHLATTRPPANPGAFDWARFDKRRGIAARIFIQHRENIHRFITPQTATTSTWIGHLLHNIRSRLHRLLIDDIDADANQQASLLDAMILGQRSRVDQQLNEVFIRAGCVHVLAVSGVHVAIVMLFIASGCRLISLHPRKATWVLIAGIIIYALIAEPRPSLWRASVMALLYCAARLLNRQRAVFNWLAASAIVLCVVNPNAAFGIGFQLSFVAVLGVIYLGPALASTATELRAWLKTRLTTNTSVDPRPEKTDSADPLPAILRSPTKMVIDSAGHSISYAFVVSVGAWCATLPLVALHFQTVHLWGVLSSVVVLPLVSISMALGFLKLAIGVLFPPALFLATTPLTLVNSVLVWSVNRLAALPFATVGTRPTPWWLVVSFYLLALSLTARYWVTHSPTPTRRRRKKSAKPPRESNSRGNHPAQQEFATVPDTPPNDVDHYEPPHAPTAADPTKHTNASINPQKTRWNRQAKIAKLACFTSASLLAMAIMFWLQPVRRQAELRVTFLAVGAGLATVLELPSGQTILFDAGSSNSYDVGSHIVVPYLRHRGITHIDRVYLSHANLDHFSGLPSIVDAVDVGTIVINRYFETTSKKGSAGAYLLDCLSRKGQPLETLDLARRHWTIGDTTFELLWPPRETLTGFSANDSSTVLRVTFANHSILLTGDIEKQAEQALLQSTALHANIMALPHHGGIVSTTAEFIRAVAASALIRSAGRTGNARAARLQAIANRSALFNTADLGAVTVKLSQDGVEVLSDRPTPILSANSSVARDRPIVP